MVLYTRQLLQDSKKICNFAHSLIFGGWFTLFTAKKIIPTVKTFKVDAHLFNLKLKQ
jgi:hypothetical protein